MGSLCIPQLCCLILWTCCPVVNIRAPSLFVWVNDDDNASLLPAQIRSSPSAWKEYFLIAKWARAEFLLWLRSKDVNANKRAESLMIAALSFHSCHMHVEPLWAQIFYVISKMVIRYTSRLKRLWKRKTAVFPAHQHLETSMVWVSRKQQFRNYK